MEPKYAKKNKKTPMIPGKKADLGPPLLIRCLPDRGRPGADKRPLSALFHSLASFHLFFAIGFPNKHHVRIVWVVMTGLSNYSDPNFPRFQEIYFFLFLYDLA